MVNPTSNEAGETWVHVPPSQQSAQGPVPKPGEPIKADSPEVVSPKFRLAEPPEEEQA